MSLSEMLAQFHAQIKREILDWAVGREIAKGIRYGQIVITIHENKMRDVDILISERPMDKQST